MNTATEIKNKTTKAYNNNLNGAKPILNETADRAEDMIEDFSNRTQKALDSLVSTADDTSKKLREASSKLADRSIHLVKKYPVHAAVGATVVGLALGLFVGSSINKARNNDN